MSSKLIVRAATLDDAPAIAEMEKLCFSSPWSLESIQHEIEENEVAMYVVAEVDGVVVGYVGVWVIIDEAHITNVAVHPDWRRKHIGAALIAALIDVTEANGVDMYTLEVRESNIAAQKLYEKFGFRSEYIRLGYYEDGEDAFVMYRGDL